MTEEELDRIIDEQHTYIYARFGRDVSINIGVAVEEGFVATKIFNKGLLITGIDLEHEFVPLGAEGEGKSWHGVRGDE